MNFYRHRLFLPTVKMLVFVLLTWFIIDQLFLKNDFKLQLHFFLENIKTQNLYLLFLAVLLMPLNWILEAVKWKILINVKSSFINLLKSVIAGITFGFITPGRSGEFIGRVMYLEEADKARVFYLSSIGGIAQSAVTVMFGVLFVPVWSDDPLLSGLVIGVSVAFLIFYFRFDLFNRLIASVPFLIRNNLIIRNEELPQLRIQSEVLFISFIRYSVYLSQYVLLMLFFGVSSNTWALFINCGVFLVAQTCSPLMPLLDFSFRGGSALFIFSRGNFIDDFSQNNIALLSAVTLVWILNLVIPSVLGYLFILNKRGININAVKV